MKNMKKVISLFLALIMCLGSFVFTASAEGETFTEDYYTYIIENGGATITDVYKNIAGDVVIPDTLGGYPVKKIYNAFNDCHYITSVDMPDTVEEIDMSFGACYKLEDVNLSENLATLDESFSSCYSLTEINIPGSVEYLSGFRYCYALENVEFELNCDIETIGFAAFDFCYSLKDFDIPYGVEKIENHAFEGCYSLGRVYIPATVKSIGKCAFHECDLRALHIPEGVEVIGENAFDACNKLEYAYIPASLKSIGEGAFFNCSDLKNVFVEGTDTSFDGKSFGYSDYKVENMTQDEVVEIMFLQAQFSKDYALADANGDKAALEEINSRVPELEALLTKLENAIVLYDEPVLENQLTVNGYKNSTAEAYAEKMGLKFEEIIDKETVFDTSTNTEAIFNKGTFPSDVQMKVEKGGENANFVFSGLFSRYESYDISFESDGERVQPDGTVKISIKLPLSFNSKNTKVYYVDENGNKTLIPSEYIDGYIVFETDHFSEYVLVDESSKIEEPSEPETPEEPSDECNCKCHKNFMTKILYKILNFFRKLFGASPCCEC